MPAPTYPVILTKTDWDKNKGIIGKAPNELGIGPAIVSSENAFKQIDWSILDQNFTAAILKPLTHLQLTNLVNRILQHQTQIAKTTDELLKLANAAYAVVQNNANAVTFTKPTFEHVRNIKQAATDFRPVLFGKKLDKELIVARKAKGYAKLKTTDFDILCGTPALATEFIKEAQKMQSVDQFEFMIATNGAKRGIDCPSGPQADQIYLKYIKVDPVSKGNAANVNGDLCKPIDDYYTAGLLRNPDAKREEVRLAWAACYNNAKSHFLQPFHMWKVNFPLDDDNAFLLCAFLQA
jgi:hypothetical protein